MTTNNDRAWVATRKGLIELRRKGNAWAPVRTSFMAEPVTMVLPPAPGRPMLAALNLGHFGVKVHASDDEGATWREVACPTYPEQPKDAAGPAWKLIQIWSLEATGDGAKSPTLWAGTLPGGLFRSDDGAASWQLVRGLWDHPWRTGWFGGGNEAPGIHSISPNPKALDELLLAVSCGGAWVTRDGGATWNNQSQGMRADFMPPEQAEDPNTQDPHQVQRCAAVPEVLWCQHHCGIWRSADNAASWQEIKASSPGLTSSFGFAVAAHPDDPNTAWFVPAVKDEKRIPVDLALCVTRTRDGGKTFEALREGLPQQDCYDLVYRHGLAVAGDGRTLMMGSTTGGVWSSADAGDSWQALPARLPPVYALRFG